MGKRISKYKVYLETFYEEVTKANITSNIDLRLKRLDRCAKAMVLNKQLSELKYNIENGIPDMDECGIDYGEWVTKEWKLEKLPNSADYEIQAESYIKDINTFYNDYGKNNKERIDTLNKETLKGMSMQQQVNMTDEQRSRYTRPVNLLENQFDSNSFSTALKSLLSDQTVSNEVLDLVFSSQISNIRIILYEIDKSINELDDSKIENDKYVKLYNNYSKRHESFFSNSKLIKEYREIKKEYPDELVLSHYKQMYGSLIERIYDGGYLNQGIENEIVDDDIINKYKEETAITSTINSFNIADNRKLKFYHKFRRLFELKNERYIPDFAKLGRAIYKMRESLTDEDIYNLIWIIKLIDKVDADVEKLLANEKDMSKKISQQPNNNTNTKIIRDPNSPLNSDKAKEMWDKLRTAGYVDRNLMPIKDLSWAEKGALASDFAAELNIGNTWAEFGRWWDVSPESLRKAFDRGADTTKIKNFSQKINGILG